MSGTFVANGGQRYLEEPREGSVAVNLMNE